jgi:hypothetical protein
MSNYQNKKKYKKQKSKDRARKVKAKKRGDIIKAENRETKEIEKIKWKNRERSKPLTKVKDDD